MNQFDNELAEVLRRAHEIQEGYTDPLGLTEAEIERFVASAEEAGLSRQAVTQALRERLAGSEFRCAVEDWVFARSADGAFYVARIAELHDGVATVKYSTGGTGKLPVYDLRPFEAGPGQRVQFFLAGTWNAGTVEKVNFESRSFGLRSWGVQHKVSFEDVRLKREKARRSLTRLNLPLALGMLLSGGILGSLVTWLLSR
jgi:hypothetical protein